VSVTVELIVGSTTRLGSGELRFSLPLTPRNGTVSPPSVPQQFGAGIVKQGAIVTIVALYVTAQVGTPSALLPGTAGAVSASQPAPGLRPGDSLRWSITYFL